MAVTDESDQYKQVPPSEAPQLLPSTEDSNFLSPGGVVAGISAFAASATSSHRSRGGRIFARIVVILILVSIVGASVWSYGSLGD